MKEIISSESFSQKFVRNHLLVLACNVSKNDSVTSISQLFCLSLNMSEAHRGPSQTSKMKLFAKIVTLLGKKKPGIKLTGLNC